MFIFFSSLFYLSDKSVAKKVYFINSKVGPLFLGSLPEKPRSHVRKKNSLILQEKSSMNRIWNDGRKIRDTMEFDGVVHECLADTNFIVQIDTGETVQCYISGKLRTNKVKIDLGDLVKIQIHKLDVEKKKGRIILRYINHHCNRKKKDKKRFKYHMKYKKP